MIITGIRNTEEKQEFLRGIKEMCYCEKGWAVVVIFP